MQSRKSTRIVLGAIVISCALFLGPALAGLGTATDAAAPEALVRGVPGGEDVLPSEASFAAMELAGGVALEAYLEERGMPMEIAAGNASFW